MTVKCGATVGTVDPVKKEAVCNGLTPGTSYTVNVTARNNVSSSSNSIIGLTSKNEESITSYVLSI